MILGVVIPDAFWLILNSNLTC